MATDNPERQYLIAREMDLLLAAAERRASLHYPPPADRRKGRHDQPHLPGDRNSRYITRQRRRGYPQRAGPSGKDDTRTRLVRGAVRPRPPGGRGRRTLPGDAKGRLPARGRLVDRLADNGSRLGAELRTSATLSNPCFRRAVNVAAL